MTNLEEKLPYQTSNTRPVSPELSDKNIISNAEMQNLLLQLEQLKIAHPEKNISQLIKNLDTNFPL